MSQTTERPTGALPIVWAKALRDRTPRLRSLSTVSAPAAIVALIGALLFESLVAAVTSFTRGTYGAPFPVGRSDGLCLLWLGCGPRNDTFDLLPFAANVLVTAVILYGLARLSGLPALLVASVTLPLAPIVLSYAAQPVTASSTLGGPGAWWSGIVGATAVALVWHASVVPGPVRSLLVALLAQEVALLTTLFVTVAGDRYGVPVPVGVSPNNVYASFSPFVLAIDVILTWAVFESIRRWSGGNGLVGALFGWLLAAILTVVTYVVRPLPIVGLPIPAIITPAYGSLDVDPVVLWSDFVLLAVGAGLIARERR